MHRTKLFAGIGVATLLVGGAAKALTIQLIIDPSFGSTDQTGATALLTMSFSEDGLDDLLTLTMENTTPDTIGSKLTAVGFELPDPPDLPSLTVTFATGGSDDYFDNIDKDYTAVPPWVDSQGIFDATAGYDVMISSDDKFEGGSAQGAPIAGESRTVILSLGDTGLTPTALATTFLDHYHSFDPATDNFVVGRFQAVGPNGADSDKVNGGTPEPATLVLLTLGGLALLRRRPSRVYPLNK